MVEQLTNELQLLDKGAEQVLMPKGCKQTVVVISNLESVSRDGYGDV